jgi:hypothetical protein
MSKKSITAYIRLISGLGVFLFLACPVENTSAPVFDWASENGEITITRYNGPGGDVAIPALIDGKPVTAIGDNAFYLCGFTRVTIGNNVTSIGERAFDWCSNLTTISLPDSVTSIGNGAFLRCSRLTSVAIPAGVTSIGFAVFAGCQSLTVVTLPDGVTSIGDCAFASCARLPAITLPDSVTSIEREAFSMCGSLTSVTIPTGVTSIGKMAFAFCRSLAEIKVAADNTAYTAENGVLYNKNLTALLAYPAGKTDLSFTIPDGVTTIGDSAFAWCVRLSVITLPDSVTSIGEEAFRSCTSLTSVTFEGTIPASGFNDNADYSAFPGDLRDKFYATDASNGKPGTYTTTATVDASSMWTKQ